MSMEATLATWELTKSQINSREKFFLLCLARRAGEDHTCFPSVARMVADTGMDRKTIVDVRQHLIEKGFVNYTGKMVGRSGQIPEMLLTYVEEWERNRKSPRLKDDQEIVDNYSVLNLTSTENGTGTSTENGTGTSTENGTLNSSLEYKNRNKSFCPSDAQKKINPVDKNNYLRKQNEKKPEWADKPKSPMADVTKQSTSYQFGKENKSTKPSPMLQEFMKSKI